MSTVNKSDSEWRAVLSPEQVRTHLIPCLPNNTLNPMVYVVQGSPSERHWAPWNWRVRQALSSRCIQLRRMRSSFVQKYYQIQCNVLICGLWSSLLTNGFGNLVFRVDVDGQPFSMVSPSLVQSDLQIFFAKYSNPWYHSSYLPFHLAIPGAVNRYEDNTLGMSRIEITCAACGGHLGHVFKGEGFSTPSESITPMPNQWPAQLRFFSADERHCVNSVSLKFHDN